MSVCKAFLNESNCRFYQDGRDCKSCEQYALKDHDTKLIDELVHRINREIHLSYSDDLEIQDHINAIAEQMKGWK